MRSARLSQSALLVVVIAVLSVVFPLEAQADAFDWRDVNGKNFMTPAKAQGHWQCRQFGGIAAFEAKIKIVLNDPNFDIDLAEQHIVEKDPWTSGFDLFQSTGVVIEAELPHGVEPAVFQPGWEDRTYSILIYHRMDITDEDLHRPTIQNWLKAFGPMYTEDYHGNTLVGYDDAAQHWIFKETFGSGYGDNGYMTYPYGYMQDRFVLAITGDVFYGGVRLVPEPGTLVSFVLVGLILSRRRRCF